jgi:hypothetical protein
MVLGYPRAAQVAIDIDLKVGDIQHPTSTSVFPIWEKICRTENCHSEIGRVQISTTESIPISVTTIFFRNKLDLNQHPLISGQAHNH